MAEFNGGGFPPRPWTVWQHKVFQRFGKPWAPNDYKAIPSMHFKIENGKPGFVFYINEPNGQPGAVVTAFAQADDFYSFLEAFEAVCHGKEEKVVIEFKTMFNGQQRLEQPMVISKLIVGINADKIIYISVAAKGKKQPIFEMLPSINVGFNGEQASKYCALGYIKRIRGAADTYLSLKVEEPPQKNKPMNQPSSRSTTDWETDVTF